MTKLQPLKEAASCCNFLECSKRCTVRGQKQDDNFRHFIMSIEQKPEQSGAVSYFLDHGTGPLSKWWCYKMDKKPKQPCYLRLLKLSSLMMLKTVPFSSPQLLVKSRLWMLHFFTGFKIKVLPWILMQISSGVFFFYLHFRLFFFLGTGTIVSSSLAWISWIRCKRNEGKSFALALASS